MTKKHDSSSLGRFASVVVLFVLSPFVAEILLGATPVSRLESLLPVMMLYGGGAVLIRELARRKDRGWTRILFLGVAYALIEEGLVFQTIFNPTLFNAAAAGGRFLGVNWIFGEWVIGYHVVWSISIPIALTEMLFPVQRSGPWLGRVGTIIFGAIYALGAFAIAFFIRSTIAPGFQAPVVYVLAAVVLIVVMAVIGVGPRTISLSRSDLGTKREAPAPWIARVTGFLAACLWFSLLHLPTSLRHGMLAILPILLGCAFAAGVFTLLRQWSASGSLWTDQHRLALVTGAMVASMLEGFFFTTAGNRVDQMGQGLASVISIVLLALFAWNIQQKGK